MLACCQILVVWPAWTFARALGDHRGDRRHQRFRHDLGHRGRDHYDRDRRIHRGRVHHHRVRRHRERHRNRVRRRHRMRRRRGVDRVRANRWGHRDDRRVRHRNHRVARLVGGRELRACYPDLVAGHRGRRRERQRRLLLGDPYRCWYRRGYYPVVEHRVGIRQVEVQDVALGLRPLLPSPRR